MPDTNGTVTALSARVDAFLEQLAYGRGLSERTRVSYGQDLRRLCDFLTSRGITQFGEVRRLTLVDFLAREQAADLADTTVVRRFNAVKVLFTWLYDEGIIRVNPAESLVRPKTVKRLPESLTEDQVRRLLSAYGGDTAIEVRNRAALELLYATGLRASELVTLRLEDVHIDEAFLRCTGKGNKQRVVPIGSSAISALREYIAGARRTLLGEKTSPLLVISKRGHGIVRETLWTIVSRAAEISGLAGEVHPHTLRHCFATHMLSHGANVRAIQEMLGHADISTTQVYTHVDAQRLLDTHRKFHPRG